MQHGVEHLQTGIYKVDDSTAFGFLYISHSGQKKFVTNQRLPVKEIDVAYLGSFMDDNLMNSFDHTHTSSIARTSW